MVSVHPQDSVAFGLPPPNSISSRMLHCPFLSRYDVLVLQLQEGRGCRALVVLSTRPCMKGRTPVYDSSMGPHGHYGRLL